MVCIDLLEILKYRNSSQSSANAFKIVTALIGEYTQWKNDDSFLKGIFFYLKKIIRTD